MHPIIAKRLVSIGSPPARVARMREKLQHNMRRGEERKKGNPQTMLLEEYSVGTGKKHLST